MPNAINAQIERGFRQALRHAGISVTWTRGDDELELTVLKNPAAAQPDGVDRNQGDDTRCILSAAASDFPGGAMPSQGEDFTDEEGRSYRVETIEHVPGHPLVHFHCGNVVTLS